MAWHACSRGRAAARAAGRRNLTPAQRSGTARRRDCQVGGRTRVHYVRPGVGVQRCAPDRGQWKPAASTARVSGGRCAHAHALAASEVARRPASGQPGWLPAWLDEGASVRQAGPTGQRDPRQTTPPASAISSGLTPRRRTRHTAHGTPLVRSKETRAAMHSPASHSPITYCSRHGMPQTNDRRIPAVAPAASGARARSAPRSHLTSRPPTPRHRPARRARRARCVRHHAHARPTRAPLLSPPRAAPRPRKLRTPLSGRGRLTRAHACARSCLRGFVGASSAPGALPGERALGSLGTESGRGAVAPTWAPPACCTCPPSPPALPHHLPTAHEPLLAEPLLPMYTRRLGAAGGARSGLACVQAGHFGRRTQDASEGDY